MSAPEAPIAFSVTSTLRDAMAAEAPPVQARAKRSARARWLMIFAMVFLLTIFVTGIYDTPGDPMVFFKAMISARMGSMAFAGFLAIVAVIAGMMLGVRAINRALRRSLFVDQRRGHPAVDANDPDLRMTRRFRFDETGMTTATDYDEVWESWRRITALDETPDLLVLRAGGILAFPLPKAQLAPELRERLQRYVDSRSHSKWPF